MAKTAVAGMNSRLVEIAMAYQRSRALVAAARLGVADALGDAERTVVELGPHVRLTSSRSIGFCERWQASGSSQRPNLETLC